MIEMDVTLAKCAKITAANEIFFPEGSDIKDKVTYAKAICSQCPIAVACFLNRMADLGSETYGIWGGTTPSERIAMSKNPKLFKVHLDKLKSNLNK